MPGRNKLSVNEQLLDKVLDLAIAVQQIPAPTFSESQRADFVHQLFSQEGLCDVASDETGNVYARLPGAGNAAPLIVSAHLDTVFPAETDLAYRRTAGRIHGPGIGDNSLGVAAMFGLLWMQRLKSSSPLQSLLPGDVWLVANVGEEGLGDLCGMRAVVDRFGEQVSAYIILEGMALGQVYHAGLGVRRYRISVQTTGGHSWVDYGQPSAVHELAALVNKLTTLPLPGRPRTSLNVGIISGGTSVNTIAPQAHIELDLRSENGTILNNLARQVETLSLEARRPDVQVNWEIIGDRPQGSIPATHPLIQLAQSVLQGQGIQPNLNIGSTDANIPLSRGLPAVCIGISHGSRAHTVGEYVQISPVAKGLAQLAALVEGAFQLA